MLPTQKYQALRKMPGFDRLVSLLLLTLTSSSSHGDSWTEGRRRAPTNDQSPLMLRTNDSYYTDSKMYRTMEGRGLDTWNHLRLVTRDVTKFAFEFDNIRTSNAFSRFEFRRFFSRTHRRIRTSGLHDRHHMSTPTGHWNNKCALPNSLKGPKIILDMADCHVSKDGPFRILGNALTYLLSDFFGITFLHFLSPTC